MKRILSYAIPFTLMLSLFNSCDKVEGEGGRSKIVGSVQKIITNGDIQRNADGTFSFKNDTVPAVGESVYIVYGDNEYGIDDKTNASYDGTFRFEYLNEGNYKIFVLNDMADGSKVANVLPVKVEGKTTYGGDFFILDGKNANCCGIAGRIFAFWKNAYDYQPGFGCRVYIQKEGSADINDTRADMNGYYTFAKLDPLSTYTIFAESEPQKDAGIKAESIQVKTGPAGTIVETEEIIKVIIF